MRSCFAVFAIMLSLGCGGKTSDNAASSSPTATATIGATGGALTSTDGHATITVPAGALPDAVALTVAGAAQPTIAGATVIGPAYRFGPPGTKLAAPATISIPYGSGQIGMEMYFAADNVTFTILDTWHFDQSAMSATTMSLGTFVVAVPDGAGIGTSPSSSSTSTGGISSSSSSGSGFGDPECVVMCEGPTNADGGIGCDCSTSCHGVSYRVDCRCGECKCSQNGYVTLTLSAPIDACSGGATGLVSTYTACAFPYAPSQLGGGGPTSNDAGGHCE